MQVRDIDPVILLLLAATDKKNHSIGSMNIISDVNTNASSVLTNTVFPRPSASSGPSAMPGVTFPYPSYASNRPLGILPNVTAKIEHDNENDTIVQNQCIFSLRSASTTGARKLLNPSSFNKLFSPKALTHEEVKDVVGQLCFQGTAIGNTAAVDMKTGKSALNSPWNTGSPEIDLFVSGRVEVYDSWPKAKPRDRLYWVLRPSAIAGVANRYKVELRPETRRLNDPTIGFIHADTNTAVQGAFFSVGTVTDELPAPTIDEYVNTFKATATINQQTSVRLRMIVLSTLPWLV